MTMKPRSSRCLIQKARLAAKQLCYDTPGAHITEGGAGRGIATCFLLLWLLVDRIGAMNRGTDTIDHSFTPDS